MYYVARVLQGALDKKIHQRAYVMLTCPFYKYARVSRSCMTQVSHPIKGKTKLKEKKVEDINSEYHTNAPVGGGADTLT